MIIINYMKRISRKICNISKTKQKKFREKILMRDKKCKLTGAQSFISEAAHIVEVKDKHLFPWIDIYNFNNGILLRSDIHKLFDLNHWYVDPLKYNINDDGQMVFDVIVNPLIDIHDLENKKLYIPQASHPYLCYRYLGYYNI